MCAYVCVCVRKEVNECRIVVESLALSYHGNKREYPLSNYGRTVTLTLDGGRNTLFDRSHEQDPFNSGESPTGGILPWPSSCRNPTFEWFR